MKNGKSPVGSKIRRVAEERERIAEIFGDIHAGIADIRDRLPRSAATEEDRGHIRHALEAVEQAIPVLEPPIRFGRLNLVHRQPPFLLRWAVENISGAVDARAFGIDPFGLLFEAASYTGTALTCWQFLSERRSNAAPKLSASTRLRALAVQMPDASAAELRRMVEAESGGRMDESAARAVVRNVRALQAVQGRT